MHFQTWQDKAGNAPPLTDPTTGLTFPDLNADGELSKPNRIMPEPTIFLDRKFPIVLDHPPDRDRRRRRRRSQGPHRQRAVHRTVAGVLHRRQGARNGCGRSAAAVTSVVAREHDEGPAEAGPLVCCRPQTGSDSDAQPCHRPPCLRGSPARPQSSNGPAQQGPRMIESILSPTHLLLIQVVALIVLGPKRLPEAGRGLGSAIRGFKPLSMAERREEQPALQPSREPDHTPLMPHRVRAVWRRGRDESGRRRSGRRGAQSRSPAGRPPMGRSRRPRSRLEPRRVVTSANARSPCGCTRDDVDHPPAIEIRGDSRELPAAAMVCLIQRQAPQPAAVTAGEHLLASDIEGLVDLVGYRALDPLP